MKRSQAHLLKTALAVAVVACVLAPTAAFPVTREAVLTRGERWVALNVPYSQSAYANEAGSMVSDPSLGWRTDCSGFISMCLGLTTSTGSPRSLDTATLPSVLIKISKTDLKPGDVILRPKNAVVNGQTVPYGHSLIFVRWVDAAKTKYVAYHESSSQKGTVASEINYPFWGEPGFAPYRYTKIEDVRLRRSRQWFGGLTMSKVGSPVQLPLGSVVPTIASPSIGATPLVAPAQ